MRDSKKYPLTVKGIDNYQSGLFLFDHEELYTEAECIAGDVVQWLTSRFETDVFTLEYVRSLPKEVLRRFGWQIAACLLERRPILPRFVIMEMLPHLQWADDKRER